MNYSEKLRDPRWQKKRLSVLNRDNFTCQLCGDTKTELQVHHKEYIKGNDPWDYPEELLTTLCKHCHGYVSKESFYPYKILKKRCESDVVLLVISNDGLVINRGNYDFVLSQPVLKEVVHTVIDYWLQSGNEHNLIDKKVLSYV